MKNLVWNGKSGYIERDEIGNILEKKPNIRGLTFDELYFEETLRLKVVDSRSFKLNENEQKIVSDFIANYKMKEPTLKQIKENAIAFIKKVTNEVLVDNYDWKILKLMEKQVGGENVKDELEDVIAKKDEIRKISNEAESKVSKINDEDELESIFDWMSEEFKRIVDG